MQLVFLECAVQYCISGMTGHVAYNTNGDRQPDFWLWGLEEEDGTFQMIAEIIKVAGITTVVSTE